MGDASGAVEIGIPVIDISGYIDGDKPQTAKIAEAMKAACISPGFFQITGHRVPAALRQELLIKLSEFFSLPAEKKRALHRNQSVCPRGYESLGEQELEKNFADQKEGFMIGPELPLGRFLQGPNQWPTEEDLPSFKDTFMRYFTTVLDLSKVLFRLMALSLNLNENFFDDFVASKDCKYEAHLSDNVLTVSKAITMCRAHRYPPATIETAQKSRGIGAHTDFGALTLLLQDQSSHPCQKSLVMLTRKQLADWRSSIDPPRPGTQCIRLRTPTSSTSAT